MSLCCLMISISDNTAADALIHIVGREAVESVSPFNQPFPTTREAFIAKTNEQSWVNAGPEGRRSLLAEIARRPLPSLYEAAGRIAPAVGWFLSADELYALLRETGDHPSMAINPGVVTKTRWKRVAFKGGQEPTVLNISLQLTDSNDKRHTIVVTRNAPEEFDPETVFLHVRAIARLLESYV